MDSLPSLHLRRKGLKKEQEEDRLGTAMEQLGQVIHFQFRVFRCLFRPARPSLPVVWVFIPAWKRRERDLLGERELDFTEERRSCYISTAVKKTKTSCLCCLFLCLSFFISPFWGTATAGGTEWGKNNVGGARCAPNYHFVVVALDTTCCCFCREIWMS